MTGRHFSIGLILGVALLSPLAHAAPAKVRVFILSGQSNMAGLNPDLSFTPAVKAAFADDEVIVVKHAQGGQPIRRWHKDWKPPEGAKAPAAYKAGDLYDALMAKVNAAIAGKSVDSVAMVWMQGERDAKEGYSAVYAEAMAGLIKQFRDDLKRPDMVVVIGRLSDNQKGNAHWDAVRAAQEQVARDDARAAWVDTDDLNGPKDDLHYTADGYKELGSRFAAKAVELLKKQAAGPKAEHPAKVGSEAERDANLFVVADEGNEAAANWPRWRGPGDDGGTAHGSYVDRWDANTNVLWKTPLPGKGCSTPIVWNERIYVTAPIEGRDALLAFDFDGKSLWQSQVGPERPGKHRNGSGSNPSPVTDGTAVFVHFKSGNLAAIELDGKVRWKHNLTERYGKDTLYWDYGSSPVLTERDVVVTMMHNGNSYLAAFDKKSGELRWKVDRNYQTPVEGDHSYATPIVYREGQREALLVWGAQHLTSHDARDGSLIWSCGDFNPKETKNWVAVASAVIVGDMAVVPYGRGSRLHGIRLGGAGDVTASHRKWLREDTGTFVPSPCVYKGQVYLVRDRGEVECIDPATGKTAWTGAMPKGSAAYYSSPSAADGKLYAAREDGVVFVAQIEGGFKVLSENDMGERVIAAPVPVANRLLIRGEKHLFCIGKPARGL